MGISVAAARLVGRPLIDRRFVRWGGSTSSSSRHLPGLLREREQSLHGLQIRFILCLKILWGISSLFSLSLSLSFSWAAWPTFGSLSSRPWTVRDGDNLSAREKRLLDTWTPEARHPHYCTVQAATVQAAQNHLESFNLNFLSQHK